MSDFTIGRAAKSAGVNVETIRFYERQQLIEQPPKPAGGGYRVYPEETIRRVRFIRRAQQLGFSLREISELLSLRTVQGADASTVRQIALEKIRDVDEKIHRLKRIRNGLSDLVEACPGKGALRCCSIYGAFERDDVHTGEEGSP